MPAESHVIRPDCVSDQSFVGNLHRKFQKGRAGLYAQPYILKAFRSIFQPIFLTQHLS